VRAAGAAILAFSLSACRPAAVPETGSSLDRRIPAILAEDGIPGAAVAWGEEDRVLYRRAFGSASPETIFDLASVTKAVGTATAAMLLVEQGRLGLEDPVSRHLPCFEGRSFTVRDLLRHGTGLPAYLSPRAGGAGPILEEISALKPGKSFVYS
jgi:CubicO group peptidase (beta-lactamase class C family)